MGKEKVYAIKEGLDPVTKKKVSNILCNTWDECKKLIDGVSGAKYKSFGSEDEAKIYLSDTKKMLEAEFDKFDKSCFHAYVDGSYDENSNKHSYAFIIVQNNLIKYTENGKELNIGNRQIQGELNSAIKAIEYCINKGCKKMVLFFDYVGIYQHGIGDWSKNDNSSKIYHQKITELLEKIRVEFVHVKAHSNSNIYNEIVDNVAKSALLIKYNNAVDKYLDTNEIKVENIEIKKIIEQFVKEDNWCQIRIGNN